MSNSQKFYFVVLDFLTPLDDFRSLACLDLPPPSGFLSLASLVLPAPSCFLSLVSLALPAPSGALLGSAAAWVAGRLV